jgi:DMSO/TMAO reductase YedYZ molybdopterin-dependent catalytic subunit
MVFRSGGLRRPKISQELQERVPPGQYATQRWPVLHYGSVPSFDPTTWDLRVFGLVERPLRFSWQEFQDLPRVTVHGDMHCVTRWSKLDNTWEGVPFRHITELAGVQPAVRFVVLHCDGDYTANLARDVIEADDALLALKHEGEDLSPEHGFPLRAIIPSRYAWKSAKWLRAIELVAADRPGFWENYGYHSNADPWKEERFSE